MIEEAIEKARAYSDNKDKIDAYYDGYVACYLKLNKQIEKMKCCQNCRKFNNLSYDCTCAEVCNEWELRR